jgi:hypothetical protein
MVRLSRPATTRIVPREVGRARPVPPGFEIQRARLDAFPASRALGVASLVLPVARRQKGRGNLRNRCTRSYEGSSMPLPAEFLLPLSPAAPVGIRLVFFRRRARTPMRRSQVSGSRPFSKPLWAARKPKDSRPVSSFHAEARFQSSGDGDSHASVTPPMRPWV